MRQKNMRVVITGAGLLLLVGVFFAFMLNLAPQSTDPKAMMETVGQVCGVVGAIAIAMIVFGLIGRRVP
jgi:hypothetical protein